MEVDECLVTAERLKRAKYDELIRDHNATFTTAAINTL